MRAFPLSFTAFAMFATVGCENWPLHKNLPDPFADDAVVPFAADVAEEPALADDALQELGAWGAPGTLTITGEAEACGWDPDAAWPIWPSHPRDLDGDGLSDLEEPWHAGWYTEDVDLYALVADAELTVGAELTWENAPEAGLNVEYRPGEPGDWEQESDLDLVLFTRLGDAADAVLREVGFSRAFPESAGPALLVQDGAPLVFAVGCHHAVPTRYTLTVDLAAL